MAGSFDGVTFKERGGGPQGPYPVWSVEGVVVQKKIPGSDDTVVQVIAVKRARVALVVKVTAAQLAALRGKLGVSGSLVFHFETTTATLVSVENAEEQGAGHDVYFATLNLVRGSNTFAAATNLILLEDGTGLLLEDGTNLLTE